MITKQHNNILATKYIHKISIFNQNTSKVQPKITIYSPFLSRNDKQTKGEKIDSNDNNYSISPIPIIQALKNGFNIKLNLHQPHMIVDIIPLHLSQASIHSVNSI
jgi:flagellar biosynthesis protein FliP